MKEREREGVQWREERDSEGGKTYLVVYRERERMRMRGRGSEEEGHRLVSGTKTKRRKGGR
eukprot:813672-Amorphochlora_amoeboformis.AAC.1